MKMSLIGAVEVVNLANQESDTELGAEISLETNGPDVGMRIVTSRKSLGKAPNGDERMTVATVKNPKKAAGGEWKWPPGVFGGLSEDGSTLSFPHNEKQIGKLIRAFNGQIC